MKYVYKYFLILFFLFVLGANHAAISQIATLLKVKVVDYSGGQVSKNYADQLTNVQGALMQNAIINVKGQFSTRLGQSLFNIDTNSPAFNGVGSFVYLNGSTLVPYVVAASGTSVVTSLSNSTQWTIINSGHNISNNVNSEFIQANNLIFQIDGTDPTNWWDGSTWHVGGTYPGSVSPPSATTGAWLSSYLFLGGNPTSPTLLYCSDSNNPVSYTAALTCVVNVSTGDGQPIEKVQPYRTGDLIIYKTHSIYDLNIVSNGNTTCTPQPTCTWTLTPLTQDVGTYAPRSVVSLGNDQWFLSGPPFGVRSVIRSQFDKTFVNLISQPIQDIFDGTNINGQILNISQVAKSAAVYYDNKYILAIPVTGSTVNNLVLVYDFITQSWYEITGWYPAEWLVYNNNLYYIDANDGRLVQCFNGTIGDLGTVIPVTSAPTVGIDTVYISKVFDFDDAEDPKTLDSILLEFSPTGAYNATIYVNLDNTGWQLAGTVALKNTGSILPLNLPFQLASPGITYGVLQLTGFGKFWKLQVKVELNGLSQMMTLQKISMYANKLPWERERN